jgi:hypothetical protein
MDMPSSLFLNRQIEHYGSHIAVEIDPEARVDE